MSPSARRSRLGAIALVGAQAYSSNTERQRAARGAVSCLLPAPDGDTPPLDGSPVNQMGGGRGRRHKNTKCFSRRRPPAAFCLLCRRGQSRSPRRAKPSPSPVPPAAKHFLTPFHSKIKHPLPRLTGRQIFLHASHEIIRKPAEKTQKTRNIPFFPASNQAKTPLRAFA